jgi:Putative metallopeptidase
MTISHRSKSPHLIAAAVVLASGCWSLPAAWAEATGKILIEYVPPKNPEHQKVYELLKERHALETLQKVFSPLRLTVDLMIKTVGCDGVPNAWYQQVDKRPTVSLCYEYVQEILQNLPKETTPAGVTPSDAVVGQLFFAAAHEVGHATFDIFDVPLFAREEDAADNFATYIMLQFGGDRAHRLIAGAAYSYRGFLKNYKQKPDVTLPLAAFSSDHGTPEARFYNLICIAYGYDAKEFADAVENEYLPKSRAKNCRYEYQMLRYAFQQLIAPHIDKDLARQVLDTNWLDDAGTRPAAQ